MLDTQYRMHPTISEFPALRFYNGNLLDGENVKVRVGPPLVANIPFQSISIHPNILKYQHHVRT